MEEEWLVNEISPPALASAIGATVVQRKGNYFVPLCTTINQNKVAKSSI